MKVLWMCLFGALLTGTLFGLAAFLLTRGYASNGPGAVSSTFSLASGAAAFAAASTGVLMTTRMLLRTGVEIRIKTPAGHTFTRILTLFISKRLFYKHFGQTIADNREEVNKALARGDFEEADKIGRELNIDLVRQIVELFISLPASIVGKVWQFAKGEKKGDE
ncbi:hypothetical protein ELI44_09100 [Rhizobium ruizarguesonis]|uniref:hypothetical protein n=1 Tax=Rhizobium ruizarguesonis TaxID=2081791 RepID=UPI00102FA52B|nr:hypothetical protein [Rhizobium ruizarguesonis]TAU48162.1 hypothetical protein ELI42_09075 [Rhizobium ruizarguesonis]TAU63233.1 hypothetical protein ELI44_09100 [Rhizobium ruizarguesonis]